MVKTREKRLEKARKYIKSIKEGRCLVALLKKGVASRINVMGRGMLSICRFGDEYRYSISDTRLEYGRWVRRGGRRGGYVSEEGAINLLLSYADFKTIRFI